MSLLYGLKGFLSWFMEVGWGVLAGAFLVDWLAGGSIAELIVTESKY